MRKVNLAKRYGMRYPSIDQLLEKSESKYRLVIGAAMRAKEIQKHNETQCKTKNSHTKNKTKLVFSRPEQNQIPKRSPE